MFTPILIVLIDHAFPSVFFLPLTFPTFVHLSHILVILRNFKATVGKILKVWSLRIFEIDCEKSMKIPKG